jgi:hypothetical protein
MLRVKKAVLHVEPTTEKKFASVTYVGKDGAQFDRLLPLEEFAAVAMLGKVGPSMFEEHGESLLNALDAIAREVDEEHRISSLVEGERE